MVESSLADKAGELLTFANTLWALLAGVIGWGGLQAAKYRKAKKEVEEVRIEVKSIQALLSVGSGLSPDELTIDAIRKILSASASNLHGVNALIKDIPAPYLIWMKEMVAPGDFRMVRVNDYFARLYLAKPAAFYQGKRDREVWGNEVADTFAEGDTAAYNADGPYEVDEPVYSPLTGVRGRFQGVKFPIFVGEHIYVCGIGRHVEDPVVEIKGD